MLNDKVYTIEFFRFHTPLLLIDVKKMNILCELTNKFLLFIENPRVNIQVISGFFDFYFKEKPDEFMMGQVVSKILISYRCIESLSQVRDFFQRTNDFFPCVLFLRGLQLQEILIYLPFHKPTFLRELRLHFIPKTSGACIICFEEGNQIVNLHQDQFMHIVCMTCLLKLDTQCPVCRQPVILFS
jgi:hypothetical protein